MPSYVASVTCRAQMKRNGWPGSVCLGIAVCLLPFISWPELFGNHNFYGFVQGLSIFQELHWLDRIEFLIQFIDNGNTNWQVRLHNGFFRDALQVLNNAPKAISMSCNQDLFPLLDLGNTFFIPEGQGLPSVLKTLTGEYLICCEVYILRRLY